MTRQDEHNPSLWFITAQAGKMMLQYLALLGLPTI